MGKIISGWSPRGHQNGVTSVVAILAYLLSKKNTAAKVLTMDFNCTHSELHRILGIKNSNGVTIKNLLNRAEIDELDYKYFCGACSEISANHYNIKASCDNVLNFSEISEKSFLKVLITARELFDIVLIDNSSGISKVSNLINHNSDLVISIQKQNTHRLFFPINKNRNSDLHIINEYSEKKGLLLGDIKRQCNLDNLFALEYNENVAYCMNSCDLSSLYKNSREENKNIIAQFNEVTDRVCNIIGVELPKQKQECRPKWFKKVGLACK